MDLASYDPVPHDEPLPLGVHRRRVGKNLQKPLDFSTSPKTSWTEKPRPLLATGRVATFQNSAMFCSVKYTGSAAASSLAMLSTASVCVVLANSNLIDTLRVDLRLFPRLIFRIVGGLGGGAGLHSQPRIPADGGARSAPPTHRSAALDQAAETDRFGPVPVGMVGSNLAGLAFCTDDRQTRDSHRLAPKGLPPLLGVEIPSWPSWSS